MKKYSIGTGMNWNETLILNCHTDYRDNCNCDGYIFHVLRCRRDIIAVVVDNLTGNPSTMIEIAIDSIQLSLRIYK